MICTSIKDKDLNGIFEILESPDTEMAEIRLDLCPLSLDEVEYLFSRTDTPLVATCRTSVVINKLRAEDPSMSDNRLETAAASYTETRLGKAIAAGAAFVDLEIDAPAMMSKRIRREAAEAGTRLIRSYHDFDGTPSIEALKALRDKCLALGGEIVKIAATAHSEDDVNRMMSLYGHCPDGNLIAFCMGEKGRQSRLDCLAKGAPFTYCAPCSGDETADGQWSQEQMQDTVYKGFIPLKGKVLNMPCSKSFAQRAILSAALAEGESILHGYTSCGDNESALLFAKAIGAETKLEGDSLIICGRGLKQFKGSDLHTGESGLLTRMIIPLVALVGNGSVKISGEKTLTRRPLRGSKEIMQAFGVELSSDSADEDIHVPLTVNGRLRAGEVTISGEHGSQIISGLLAALPLAKRDSVLTVLNPKSIPYLFITLDVLKAFGINIECEMEGGEDFADYQDFDDCNRITFHIPGKQSYRNAEIQLEGDWSSAAPFLTAGAIFGEAYISGVDTSSLQADLCILDILAQAGASISKLDDTGYIHVQRAPLCAFETDASNCPDLFPVLAILAAFCQGTSKIRGTARLGGKESDRGKSILEMLQGFGVSARIKGNCLTVKGESLASRLLNGRMLKGGGFNSHDDHRIAMALSIASIGAEEEVTISGKDCVNKSFPEFYDLFESLGA